MCFLAPGTALGGWGATAQKEERHAQIRVGCPDHRLLLAGAGQSRPGRQPAGPARPAEPVLPGPGADHAGQLGEQPRLALQRAGYRNPQQPRRHRRPELLGEVSVRRGLLPAIGTLATKTTVRVLPAALPRQREDPPAKPGAPDRQWAPGLDRPDQSLR